MRYVVVGGGVAGVCCAEELCRERPGASVTLVAAGGVLKGVTAVARVTRTLEELRLQELGADALPHANLTVVRAAAAGIDAAGRRLLLASGGAIPYDALCVATGARPRPLPAPAAGGAAAAARLLALRDADSLAALGAALRGARRAAVVGNGGIALELVGGLKGVDLVWVMRHAHVGDAFFDADAAEFLLEELRRERAAEAGGAAAGGGVVEGPRPARGGAAGPAAATTSAAPPPPPQAPTAAAPLGAALGPAWAARLPGAGAAAGRGRAELEYGAEVAAVEAGMELTPEERAAYGGAPSGGDGTLDGGRPWPLSLVLTTGRRVGVDFAVAALGVDPAVGWVPAAAARAPDGGLLVGRDMQTSLPGVYAAGDAATPAWAAAEPGTHWFQVRLWSQARAAGVYAAHCMAGVAADRGSSMAFELFAHVTRFLGRRVVLLGLYNGQRLEAEPDADLVSYSRVDEGGGTGGGRSFVRVLLLRGRVQGAVLVGDTELAETFENLILDRLDVGGLGPALLDPDVDLDHVFD